MALAAVAVATAVAAAVLVIGDREESVRRLTVAAAANDAGTADGALERGDAGGVEAASAVVRRAIDPTVPLAERAALFERRPSVEPTVEQVLASFDGLGERAGADLRGATVSARLLGATSVVADVRVELDGTFGSRSTLRSLVVQLVGGDWQLTRESLCGLAAAASTLGSTTQCSSTTTVRHGPGSIGPAAMLSTGSGDPIDLTDAVPLGYWSDQTAELDESLWFVDYPQVSAGGGAGPVGPADLVRVDLGRNEETARVRVAGGVTDLAAGDGSLWALHTVVDPNGVVGRTALTRIDSASADITGEIPVGLGAAGLVAVGDEVWVHHGDRLHRFAGPTLTPTGSVVVGPLPAESSAVVGTELWVRRFDSTVLAIDRSSSSSREVAAPRGRLVGSGGRVWAVETGIDGTTARLLDHGGAEVRSVHLDGSADGSSWGDGDGGIWVTGSALTPTTADATAGVVIDVVSRPFAAHLSAAGEVTGTWWAEQGSRAGAWFASAGNRLGLSDGSGLRLLPTT